MRTTFLRRLSRAFGTVAVTACLLGQTSGARAQQQIAVMAWGTSWIQGLTAISDEFTKTTGIKVIPVTQSGSSDGYARLKSMRDAPTIDVWFSTASLASRATQDKKLFAPIPASALSNAKNLVQGARTDTWVAAYYYPLSIIYRPDLVKKPITSWKDLWDPSLANSLAVPDVETYAGRMLLVASLTHGGTMQNTDPGFKALSGLRPNIAMFYGSDSDARRALAQGDVSVLVGPPSQLKPLVDAGVKVKALSVQPAPMMFDVMTVVNTKNQAAAMKFIDFVLSPQAQSIITRQYFMGPVNDTVQAAPALAAILPKQADQVSFDETYVNDHIGAWNERFKSEIAK
jgi:putative spermidine/putrescine transport system substrate-binding protein